jgi:hypothetical protein
VQGVPNCFFCWQLYWEGISRAAVLFFFRGEIFVVMSSGRNSGGSNSGTNATAGTSPPSSNSSGGFGVRNFLRDTLAAKPAFLEAIKTRGQDIRSNLTTNGSSGSGGATSTNNPILNKKPRANSLLPGDTDLIDQKALFDADNIIAEADFYLNRVLEDRPQRNTMLDKLKKLSRVGSGPGGNGGRGAGQSSSQYHQLLQRLSNTETKLKEVVNDAVAQESSFTLQALHLTIRVKSCVVFNKDTLPPLKEELEEAQALEADLDRWIKLIASMTKFSNELQSLNDMQYRYVPASLRPKPNPEDVKKSEEWKADVQHKLKKTEKVLSAPYNIC